MQFASNLWFSQGCNAAAMNSSCKFPKRNIPVHSTNYKPWKCQ